MEDEDEEDLMANFGIEVESDGGGEYPANQHGLDNGFNENDFKLYQKQRFGKAQHLDLEDEASQDFASEREDQILSLLDPEQHLMHLESQIDDEETDDYGMKVSSPLKLQQHQSSA